MVKILPSLALCTLLVAPVAATPQRVVFEPQSTELAFTLDTTLHTVHGSLAMTAGELVYDLATGEARGELVIDATAAETGNRKRDTKMHGKVLETELFPRFVFHAEQVAGELDEQGAGEVQLTGTLEIHGESHPFTLPAQVTIADERVTAHAEFQIPYVEWGMKDPSFFLLRAAKVVDVIVDAEGRVDTQDSSSSAP